MACCYRIIQTCILIFMFAAIGLVVAACSIDYWWVTKAKTSGFFNLLPVGRLGLWRSCFEIAGVYTGCTKRDDIFQFSIYKNLDIILVALCASGSCYIASFLLNIVTICQKYPTKCLVLVANIVTFIGAGISGFAIAWCFLKISSDVKIFSWGIYCLFAETILAFIAFFMLCLLLCISTPNPYHATRKDDEIIMLSR